MSLILFYNKAFRLVSLYLNLYYKQNKVLALKPSCTRSQTEVATKDKDGPEATANLAHVETAEPVTEAVSHKARDLSSSEYIITKRIIIVV